MTIYILLKEAYGFEGATETQEITAYYNKEEALKIKNAYTVYREQIEALDYEYKYLKSVKLKKENREKCAKLRNPDFDKWDYMSIEAVEVK